VLSKALRKATYRVVTQRSRQSSKRRAAKPTTKNEELGVILEWVCIWLAASQGWMDVGGEDGSHARARDETDEMWRSCGVHEHHQLLANRLHLLKLV